jgi:hypothetical protein
MDTQLFREVGQQEFSDMKNINYIWMRVTVLENEILSNGSIERAIDSQYSCPK